MKTVILATGNKDKLREVREILPQDRVISMKEAGVDPEIVEDGTTFLENATIKTDTVASALLAAGIPFDYVMADDSGLEIDFFDKQPGIYSSRWLGEDTPYTIKNQIVLDRMQGVPEEKRTARYVCAMVAVTPAGRHFHAIATAEGVIGHEPSGSGGFGYDPIFVFPGLGTFGDLTPEQKNAVSHRGKAVRALARILQEEAQKESAADLNKGLAADGVAIDEETRP